MTMFAGYFEVSVNFNLENQREKFIFPISNLYPILQHTSQELKSFTFSLSIIDEFFYVIDTI